MSRRGGEEVGAGVVECAESAGEAERMEDAECTEAYSATRLGVEDGNGEDRLAIGEGAGEAKLTPERTNSCACD
jgi:hypothetical protein